MAKRTPSNRRRYTFLLALPMLGLMVVPVIALALASSPADLSAGLSHPVFAPAL